MEQLSISGTGIVEAGKIYILKAFEPQNHFIINVHAMPGTATLEKKRINVKIMHHIYVHTSTWLFSRVGCMVVDENVMAK